jgi:hypothetical protein
MITNTGKNIIAKYMIGQAPAYASYIAIGCGAQPLGPTDPFNPEAYADKKNLDFEMFRAPIISRGYVSESGVSKVVLTAELPTEERYEITEIGVFSAASNPSAGERDSRNLYTFSQEEAWAIHTPDEINEIPIIYQPLDGTNGDNIIIGEYVVDGVLTETPIFETNANNTIFSSSERRERYENCRFYNNILIMSGDSSTLTIEPDVFSIDRVTVQDPSTHVHITGTRLESLSKNSPEDEIRLALSVINKDGSSASQPDNLRVLVEFGSTDVHGLGEYARFELDLDNGTGSGQHDFATNRYVIATKKLKDLVTSSSFTWNTVDTIKIYACVNESGTPSSDFYVCLDAIRLENIAAVNPVYGMTGYSVVKTEDAGTVIKLENTNNMVEFRFAIGVE